MCNKQKWTVIFRLGLLMTVMMGGVGCARIRYGQSEQVKFSKPTIAVMSFEDRTTGDTKWNLSDHLAEQLTYELMEAQRYVVLQHEQLSAILREIERSNQQQARQRQNSKPIQLKNVHYLVTGTITDFGQMEAGSGLGGLVNRKVLGSSNYSVVAVILCVLDAQSGQTIACQKLMTKSLEKDDENVDYTNLPFGSYAFYETPLGAATRKLLDKAVEQIARAIEERPYQLKIVKTSSSSMP